MHGILDDWNKNKVKTVSDAEVLIKTHAAKVAMEKSAQKNNGKISNFNDFKQSTSDIVIDDMERRLRKEVNG